MLIAIVPILLLLWLASYFFDAANSEANRYILSKTILNLVESFFVFGIYPIICKRIGLVITEKQFNAGNPTFYDTSPLIANRRTPGDPT